jgi:hypothetical protein
MKAIILSIVLLFNLVAFAGTTNYDSTLVGKNYVRGNNINIQYPPNGLPIITVSQANAVKMLDGSVVEISQAQSLTFSLDLVNNALTSIPEVDPTSGASLGINTNLQAVMLGVLAVVRQQQILKNP